MKWDHRFNGCRAMSQTTSFTVFTSLPMKRWSRNTRDAAASPRITCRRLRLLSIRPRPRTKESMDLRAIQKPLKEKYRSDPNSSRITLRAQSDQTDTPIACSIEVGEKILEAQAHSGVGGPGTAACSGDLLLAALAGCAQLTCQLVATAMCIPFEHIRVEVEGEMDLSGTLGISK